MELLLLTHGNQLPLTCLRFEDLSFCFFAAFNLFATCLLRRNFKTYFLISFYFPPQALLNNSLRNASFQLPDGSLIIPGQKPSTPSLAGALRQHQAMRSPSLFHLPDKSVLTGAPKPTPPNLAAALRRDNLQGVTYR